MAHNHKINSPSIFCLNKKVQFRHKKISWEHFIIIEVLYWCSIKDELWVDNDKVRFIKIICVTKLQWGVKKLFL